jgi:hypothetical protein
VGGGIYHLSLTPPRNFEKISWVGNIATTFVNLVGVPDSIEIVVSQDGNDNIDSKILIHRVFKKRSEAVVRGVLPGS